MEIDQRLIGVIFLQAFLLLVIDKTMVSNMGLGIHRELTKGTGINAKDVKSIRLEKGEIKEVESSTYLGAGVYVEIGNLPATVTIHEDTPASTFLYSVTSWPKAASCVFATASTHFEITTANSQHTVTTKASVALDFATPVHLLEIRCSDSGTTATSTLTVSITENVAPVFTNLPGAVSISAKTVKADHVIYTVSYTDTDDDPPLTYSNLVTSPASGPFSIANDQLKVTSDLLSTTVTFYQVTFDVTDARVASSHLINVTIDNTNSAPEFVGSTDVNTSRPEHTSGRVLIYDIDSLDAQNDDPVYAYQTNDANNDIFDLNPASGQIFLISGNSLDFENRTTYTFLVTVSDYLDTQTTIFTLTLHVTDINEAPTYTGTPNSVTLEESPNGTVVGTLSALCTDPDNVPPDNITYSILFSTYSTYFTIDSVTAEVSLIQDWDYDTATSNSINLTVRCSDLDGVSDDATYSITFTDINDNDPICTPAVTTFNLAYSQIVNETILNIPCTDADSTVNAELNYTTIGLQSGYSIVYFDVDSTGNLSIRNTLNMTFNTTFFVTVLITDNGSPGRSDTVTITISYTEEPTFITWDNPTHCFFCTTGTITLTAALSLVAAMLLVLAIVLTVLRLCYAYERRKMKKAFEKKKKKKWRLCGCCRPEEIKKPKKSKEEIQRAEKVDREYMRARNALLGAEDPQRDLDKQWRKGQNISSFEKARMHGLATTSGPRPSRGGPSTLQSGVSFKGRDRTPAGTENVAGLDSLTTEQRLGLQKFKDMQKSGGEATGPVPTSSTANRTQAASDMVWTFQGRDK